MLQKIIDWFMNTFEPKIAIMGREVYPFEYVEEHSNGVHVSVKSRGVISTDKYGKIIRLSEPQDDLYDGWLNI